MKRGEKRRENRMKRDALIREEFHSIRDKKNAQGLRPAIDDVVDLLGKKYALETNTIYLIVMEKAQYNPSKEPAQTEQPTLFDQL